jgi:hypothetical protein
MPIPVMNYAALQPYIVPPQNQFAGIIEALQKGLLTGSKIKEQRQGADAQKLANALTKINLKNAPAMNEADLQYKQAQTPYLQAQTNALNTDTNFVPLKNAISAAQVLNSNQRFGQSYQLSLMLKNMPTAARDAWIAHNPEAYTAMMNDMANQGNGGGQSNQFSPADFLAPVLSQYYRSGNIPMSGVNNPAAGSTDGLQISPEQIDSMSNNPQMAKLGARPSFSTSPEQAQQIQKASEISANNALTTTATRNQLEGGIQTHSIMNDPSFIKKAQDAAEYAGALGRGKSVAAAFSQTDPEKYENAMSFRYHDMVLIENRIKSLDKMGTTDSQREELHGLYDKTMNSLTSNKQQFMQQLGLLKESLERVEKAVQKSASPIFNVDRIGFGSDKSMSNNTQQQMVTLDEINGAAKKLGITPDEVKKRLQQRGISFNG